MMGRRRDERHALLGVAQSRDQLVDFLAGELAAFAGLRALGEFYLQFLGAFYVARGDAETAGGDLLDAAVRVFAYSYGIKSAFAAVGHGADEVEGFGDGFVGFRRNGAQ